jgi:Kef-type K+ transport system membrane component KefB
VPDATQSIVVIALASAATPIIVALLPEKARPAQVVILLALGIVIGPEVLDLARSQDVSLLSGIGQGFVFLLAGYELEPAILRQRTGQLAIRSWLTSISLALGLVLIVRVVHGAHSYTAAAIAMTTTALGMLLPIMRENGMQAGRFGQYVFAAGALGELGPILAMSVFLGSRRPSVELVLIALFLAVAATVAIGARRLKLERIRAIIASGEDQTTQTSLRLTVALLAVLLALTSRLGFDSVLGAFVAGFVLRAIAPDGVGKLERKLDAVGWGVFIPVFFITSGMNLDIRSIAQHPLEMIAFFAVILVVRGGPCLLWYRKDLKLGERVRLALLASTTLPLLVALTSVAVAAKTMTTSTAASLVGAGVLTVAAFPMAAVVLFRRLPAPAGPVEELEAGSGI